MQFWAPDDGRKDCPKHVERFTRINNFRNRCILLIVLWEYVVCTLWLIPHRIVILTVRSLDYLIVCTYVYGYLVYVHVVIVLESECTLVWSMSLWIPCHSCTMQYNLLSSSPQIHNHCGIVENYWKYSSKENFLFALCVSYNETHRGCAGKGPCCLDCGTKWMRVGSMTLQPSTMEFRIPYISKITRPCNCGTWHCLERRCHCGKKIETSHCIKTQKSAVLSHFVTEAWNHAWYHLDFDRIYLRQLKKARFRDTEYLKNRS